MTQGKGTHDPKVSRGASTNRYLIGWGILLFIPVFGVCGWLLSIFVFYWFDWSPNWMGGCTGIILVISSVLFAISRRLRARGAGKRMEVDSRPPVLFLRSFRDDQPGLFATDTYEQHLGTALQEIGPVIAVGQPQDALPPLGADRFYLQHDEWQQSVTDLMKRARLVVILAGATPGLLFEIRTAIRLLDPKKLLISLPERLKPPELPFRLGRKQRATSLSRQHRYEQFKSAVKDDFPHPLPETIGRAIFIGFDNDWVPQLLTPRKWRPYNLDQPSRIRETIRSTCEGLGIRLRRTRTILSGIGLSALIVISVAAVAFVGIIQLLEWLGGSSIAE